MSAESLHTADGSGSPSFPGYDSITQIYEGAETFVYRARATSSGAHVILKQTKNEYPTARELQRLRREFTILRELGAGAAPEAIALDEHDRGLVLVMADLGLPTLREVLEARRLDIESSLRIAISILNALTAVHDKNVIHKDLTPRNILVDEPSCVARLIDFGISARLARELRAPSSPQSLEGTLLYLAPEQTGKMNRAVDARSDLYSFGVILYEMLTGSVPFPERDPTDIVQCHLARTPVPARERVPTVPQQISDIVSILLAKTPEERYQSDAGLRADLEECLRQWAQKKAITPFPLRRRDKATELRRSQRLHGREKDIEALLSAFGRARARGPELCLVAGYSGIGKSALVHEIHKSIVRTGGGYFVSGKFDQISRDVPLAPVVQALRELARQILTEPPEALARWKNDLLRSLGGNGGLVCELVPELSLVIGAQPAAAELPPDQAKNRFELTLQNFLHVFASETHPLVIFLDDLQWMDPASQRLLQNLLTDVFSRHILIIGAYRDNEVGPGHPLSSMLADLDKAGFRATRIHLEPLDRSKIELLVADTLTSSPEEVATLAAVVHEKTGGNPFFAHQFMVALRERDLLVFDAHAGAWKWDADAIRAANVTDNVVDLMVSVMRRLSKDTQDVLMLAACIGHSFDFGTLVTIAERAPDALASALWGALRAGLVLSLDGDARYLEAGAIGSASEASSALFDVRYQFVHDRVLSAAYALLPADQRPKVHLSIGRLLQRRRGGVVGDELLLELVHHLNLGAAVIDDRDERRKLAELNLRAGRKARLATAHHAGVEYTRAGIALLDEADWTNHYDICFALWLEGGQNASLDGDHEGAEALFGELSRRAKTPLAHALIDRHRIYNQIARGQYKSAIEIGSQALASLGHPLPMEDIMSPQVMMAEVGQITTSLRGRRIEEVASAPAISDPIAEAVLAILESIGDGAHNVSPIAFMVINFRAVNTALVYGNHELCALPFACVGYALATMLGRVADGVAFCELAAEINKKYPSVMQLSRLLVLWGGMMHMQFPLRSAAAVHALARQKGFEGGDYHMTGVGLLLETATNILAGEQIEGLLEEVERNLALCRRTRNPSNIETLVAERQIIRCLAGKTRDRTSLDDDDFNEKEWFARLDDEHCGTAKAMCAVLKMQVCLVHGRYDEAFEASAEAERTLIYLGGDVAAKMFPCFRALVLLGLPRADDPAEAARRAEMLTQNMAEMRDLANGSPQSFGHLKALADAETARISGDLENAVRLYEQAITLSQENRSPWVEALADELCAKFYLSIGAPTAGGAYMKNAYRAYAHWGAITKTTALETESAHIWPALREVSRTRSASASNKQGLSEPDLTQTSRTLLANTNLGSLRDAALVVRAAQEIASEIDLPKVIDRLAKLVLDNAGADHGALILSRDGKLHVEARLGAEASTFDKGGNTPLEKASECAKNIVHYVARTQETVVIDDARKTSRFTDDPYLANGGPRSILCLPLLHQGRLSGVLYLENRSATGVFNAARVQLLALLSSQAAIAIEIARLIESSRAANEEVKRINERLEMEVAHRTEELRHVNESLTLSNEQLENELAFRRGVEQERATLQEQVITAQRARLAELSTPLLPITKDIVVMPLIGTMDTERAEQVLTVALDGAQRLGARVVILDVTGLKHVDTHVAGTLVNVATALRLLGAETVLTGIAPKIAQTLIALDVNLASFVTRGNLQSGMDYALKRARGRTV